MNRGVLQSSPVQQMMGGSPHWWNINNMRPPPSQPIPSSFLPTPPNLFPNYTPPPPSPASSASLVPPSSWNDNHELPESWSQLLLRGFVGEEQQLHQHPATHASVDVKQENSLNIYMYGNHENAEFQAKEKPTWSQMMPVSSPKSSCVTTLSSNMLDFSSKSDARHPPPDHSSECNSTATGGAAKKARLHPTSTQSTFKVRKEKLGDRITALHQLVSPFGKTDTASVLLEAIGYIRFLQNQIEALSLTYLGNGSGNMRLQQVQGERNCLFPEDPGQLLHDNHTKKRTPSDQDCHDEVAKKDLRSRGLCLVPLSCTLQVGSDNGADYWAPSFNGGFR